MALRTQQLNVPSSTRTTALSSLPRPGWMKNGSPLDLIWEIETDDPKGRRNTRARLNFDVGLYPGERLTAAEHDHLLLTAYLFVYHGLMPQGGWTSSARKAADSWRDLLWLLR